MNNEKRIAMLREMPIPQLLLKMGIPTMIGMLVTGFYSLIDAYFVGGLGTSQMGAVSVTFPLGQAIVGIAVLFGGGAASCLSRLLGEKNYKQANRVASTALYSSLILGVMFIILIVCFIDKILYALGATETIMPYARQYAYIYVISSIFNIFNVTMNNIGAGEGATKISMFAMLLGAALNTVFAPVFIFVFHMGITGAAVATAFAQGITSLMYVIYILQKKSVFSFSPKNLCFDGKIYSQILKIGVALLVFQLATSIAISLTNTAAGKYGDAAIAAMGIVTRIASMGIYAVFGFAKGFQPIAGYNYSAKQYERLKSAIKVAVIWTTVFSVCLVLAMMLFSKSIISLFTTDTEVIKVGVFALRANMITFIFFGMDAIYSMLSLALGKAFGGWILSIGRQGIFFIPVILLLPKSIGLNGVVFAQPIADILTIVVIIILAVILQKDIKDATNSELAEV